MRAAQTTIFIFFKYHLLMLHDVYIIVSPVYHVQISLSCSLHCCNYFCPSHVLTKTFQDKVTSPQSSHGSVGWPLSNDYGLELECADALENQLEEARQCVYKNQDIINKLRMDMHESYARVNKMKQVTEETTRVVEIL